MRTTLSMIAGCSLLLFVALSADNEARAAESPLVVVVSAATPIADISTAQLRRTFLGEAVEYAPGKRFIPINQPLGSRERVRFDRRVLGLDPDEVGRFWVDRRIRDQSGAPRSVPSASLALRVAVSLVGAVSYITSDQLTSQVRALTIDGKKAQSGDYLLAQ